MEKFFGEKIKVFIGGSVVGWLAGIKFLFGGTHRPDDMVVEYIIKFFATIIFAFMSGLMTVIAKDFYDHKIKNRLFKNKKDKL